MVNIIIENYGTVHTIRSAYPKPLYAFRQLESDRDAGTGSRGFKKRLHGNRTKIATCKTQRPVMTVYSAILAQIILKLYRAASTISKCHQSGMYLLVVTESVSTTLF